MVAFTKLLAKFLSFKRLQRYDCFFPKHMAQNCQNRQTLLQKRAICTGRKQSYFYNCLSERDLAYIFINSIISAFQGIVQTYFDLHNSISQRQFYFVQFDMRHPVFHHSKCANSAPQVCSYLHTVFCTNRRNQYIELRKVVGGFYALLKVCVVFDF